MTDLRRLLRGAVIRTAGALRLEELTLAGLHRTGGVMHAVNFHGTPSVTREGFTRQLEWLRNRYAVLNPTMLGSFWENTKYPQRPSVLLTFDDGLASNFRVAAPVLESLGLRGLFFVNPGFSELQAKEARKFFLERLAAGPEEPCSPEDWTPMTPAQISELAARGHAIGNHTYSHVDLSRTEPTHLAREIVHSRDVLFQWTGRPVDHFAWTYRWNAISSAAWDVARSHHRFCFAPCAGLNLRRTGLPEIIWRTNVESSYSSADYRFMYSGLAALAAWPKRRQLKSALCQETKPIDPAGEERGWLVQ